MPYKDPEKRKRAARDSMRRKRTSPDALAAERQQKAIGRGGDSRPSTRLEADPEAGKARHGFVDRLAYNYGHAEGGKPQVRDLKSVRVRRGGDFEPDQPASDYQRTLRTARQQTKLIPFVKKDPFANDSLARDLFVYFRVRLTPIKPHIAIDLAMRIRRFGVDPGRLTSALIKHSDLSPAKREVLAKETKLSEGQLANAILILRGQGLLREHENTWPTEYSLNPPADRG